MLRVAFATSDGIHVDQHFGWCNRFDVYELTAEQQVLLGSRIVVGDSHGVGETDKLDERIEAIRDCAIVHLTAIGGGAAARVTNARIHPLKVPDASEIASLLDRFRSLLAGTPPPWLRRLAAVGTEIQPEWRRI